MTGKGKNRGPSMIDVMKTLHNDKCLCLFNSIAIEPDRDTYTIMTNLNVRRTHFYKMMASLLKTGLVRRMFGKYTLTSMGKIVYHAQNMIGNAIQDYWKLKLLDSMQDNNIPIEERNDIIDTIINNKTLKTIIEGALA